MPVVDAADAAVSVVQNSVHGLPAEPEPRHGGAEGPSQIVRRRPLNSGNGAYCPRYPVECIDRSTMAATEHESAGILPTVELFADDHLCRRRYPHPIAVAIFGATPDLRNGC